MNKIRHRFSALKKYFIKKPDQPSDQSSCQFQTDKQWLALRFHHNEKIRKPDEVENEIVDPPVPVNEEILDRIQGSLMGMALGDALGAHVEFRPHQYLVEHPVDDLQGGGTWGLTKGQFTDDTSMALCLANSLVARHGFVPYDQLVRYKWWYQHGYMSSTGQCFDIGSATKQSLDEFIHRQHVFAKKQRLTFEKLDYLSDSDLLHKFNVYCSASGVAGNGALMRLAPVPLFFYAHPKEAIEFSGYSGQITHGDRIVYDACRYYSALIVAALCGYSKEKLLNKDFYETHRSWFGSKRLCDEIRTIAEGSFKRQGGYDEGIRGKGYIVNALEAALWAFWSDDDSFEKGVLAAINLGDDTDTTAAIYGQLAGAYYKYSQLPKKWVEQVYAKKFILQTSKWIAYEGKNWNQTDVILPDKAYVVSSGRATSFANLLFSENPIPNTLRRTRTVSENGPSRNRLSSALIDMNLSPLSISDEKPSSNDVPTAQTGVSSHNRCNNNGIACINHELIPEKEQQKKLNGTPILKRKKK